MWRRAIVLFPTFPNDRAIDILRAKYDPLARVVSPHITLVFPFASDIATDDLGDHVSTSLRSVEPFTLTLQGFTGADNAYLFLNVKVGNDGIVRLHDRLYTRVLKPFLHRAVTYTPHLTIGRLDDRPTWDSALGETHDWNESFTTIIREVVVVQVEQPNESTTIEVRVPLDCH